MQEEHPAERKPNMTETNSSIQSLQNTIDKYKKLAQEQAQVIVQKELKISWLEKSCREKDAAYAKLLQQKEEQRAWLERKIESERRSEQQAKRNRRRAR
jgi:hypothetical protein